MGESRARAPAARRAGRGRGADRARAEAGAGERRPGAAGRPDGDRAWTSGRGLAHLRRAVELAPQALQPRFALAEEVERAGAPDADAQALALSDALRSWRRRTWRCSSTAHASRLRPTIYSGWMIRSTTAQSVGGQLAAAGMEQYQALQQAIAANDLGTAQRTTLFLRNVLARVPAFGEDLRQVRTPAELIAEPIERFIALAPPPATPAAARPGAHLRRRANRPALERCWIDWRCSSFRRKEMNRRGYSRRISPRCVALTGPAVRVALSPPH